MDEEDEQGDEEDEAEDDSEENSGEENEAAEEQQEGPAASAPAAAGQVEEEQAAEPAPAAKKQKLDGSIVAFMKQHAVPTAAVARERTPAICKYTPKKPIAEQPKANKKGRGSSKKAAGSRKNDVSRKTLQLRLDEHPGQHLKIVGLSLWCGACKCEVGSSKQDTHNHVCKTVKHRDNVAALDRGDQNQAAIQSAIHEYKGVMAEEHGPNVKIMGMERLPEARTAPWVRPAARTRCVNGTDL